jgi:4a-hydroxytetrahydrobiopterin dehydratase
MADDLDALASHTISRSTLSPDQLAAEVAQLGARWSIAGTDLQLELRGQPMARGAAVVLEAARLADELNHHPRIVLEYQGLTLAIHTHDKQAITVLDLVYAARLERWLRANGW